MRSRNLAASAGALLLLGASIVNAKHGHNHLDVLHQRRHVHQLQHRSQAQAGESGIALRTPEKRGGEGEQCRFPDDAGLVAVTPDAQNAGWAMSPDQPCLPDSYCPYACPPGQVMMQWDPTATSYSYPKSMNGGLYCDSDGNIQKPFPDRPYCQDAKYGIGALNKAGGSVAFCQTVLPGNEAMLIPTSVEDKADLAVPGTDYWCGTAAHYYINPPGVGCDEACVWGNKESPVGNWSPYVAGANVDKNGQTFIKLGWNPIYLEKETPFRDEMPNWGVKIECDGEGCNGLPCAIDPAVNKVNEMVGSSSTGAGGADFCVVTVPNGVNANFVVFDQSGGGGDGEKDKPSEDTPVPASQSTDAANPSVAPSSYPAPSPYSAPRSPSDPSLSNSASSGDQSFEADENILPLVDENIAPSDDDSTPPPAPRPESESRPPVHSPLEFFERNNSTIASGSAPITPSASQTSPIVAVFTGGASTERTTVVSGLLSSLMVLMTLTLSR